MDRIFWLKGCLYHVYERETTVYTSALSLESTKVNDIYARDW